MTKRHLGCRECGCIAGGECAETRADRMERALQAIADMDISAPLTVAQDLIETELGIESSEEGE